MAKDPRETYYEKRLDCLKDKLDDFKPEVTLAALNTCWVYDALEKRVNAFLTRYDLSRASFNVLAVLEQERCLPLSRLSELLVKTAANITGLIDGLEKRGLVRRVSHPEDRRVKLAELLPAGEELIGEILPLHHQSLRGFFSSLDERELQTLTTLMKKILESDDKEEPR